MLEIGKRKRKISEGGTSRIDLCGKSMRPKRDSDSLSESSSTVSNVSFNGLDLPEAFKNELDA